MTVTFEPVTLTISVLGIILIIWQGIKFITKKNVEHLFNKNIETHKHELQKIIELNKFDFQRKLQDFSLYTAKKHESYQKVYNLFLIADGKSRNLLGLRSVPDYLSMNSKQLEYFFKKYEIPDVMVEEYLKDWDHVKHERIQDLKELINRYEISSARTAWIEAKNEYLFSRLYLSNKVLEICDELSKAIGSYLLDVESVYDKDYPREERKRVSESIEKNNLIIDKSLVELRNQMMEEIGVGNY